MSFSRTPGRLLIAAILVLVAAVLGWLYFDFAEDSTSWTQLVTLPPANDASAGHAPERTTHFLVDGEHPQTLAEVLARPPEAWRAPRSGGKWIKVGDGSARWLRVTWRNPTARAVRGVVATSDFFIDRIDAWVGEDDGGWRHERTGESVPEREKTIAGRQAAVAIDVPAHGERTAYFRLSNPVRMGTVLQWWPEAEQFHRVQARGLVADGIYFGGLLALLGYNLVLWVRLRFTDIGWYVLYLGSMLLFLLLVQGQAQVFGWVTSSPGLETVLVAAMAATAIFLTGFARGFLELPARLPRGDRVLRAARLAMIGLAAGALTIPWTDYYFWTGCVAAVGIATHALLVGLAIAALRAGARQARYFLVAFGCMFLGALALAVQWFGNLGERFAGSGLMVGSALEMLVLSLAVADRFAQTQARLVEETEQRRAIQEAYADELEIEVRERTRELEAANADKDRMLIALGHDLRSPVAALTQRAEGLRGEAPAGERAPGALGEFAGEVAGAGRQILLLIEDIVLWARLRTGANPATALRPVTEIVIPGLALHAPYAVRRGVALDVDVPPALHAWTDLVLAQTLVRNLVGNAVKFARTRVEVTAAAQPDRVSITVRDDGPGLPAGVLARLRGAPGGEVGGGTGLRLSQEIGVTLGATFDARVLETGGTEIRVTLPARAPAKGSP